MCPYVYECLCLHACAGLGVCVSMPACVCVCVEFLCVSVRVCRGKEMRCDGGSVSVATVTDYPLQARKVNFMWGTASSLSLSISDGETDTTEESRVSGVCVDSYWPF